MKRRVFVPQDSTALSLGANQIATALELKAISRGESIELVRNGSWGMSYLEPLLEVDVAGVRHAYGPVSEDDIDSLLSAGFLHAMPHPLYLGPTLEIPYLKRQTRFTFARAGRADPLDLDAYLAVDGYAGLHRALEMSGSDIVAAILESGLRGRGGAAFPTGVKWQTVLQAPAPQKYIVCNADEGDSGTFSDRMLMENDPFTLIEGMTIAGIATGATRGYIYVRSEYPHSVATLRQAVHAASQRGYLGDSVHGSCHAFDIEVRMAAGSYVCGEETALLESLEGKRGVVRAKPPVPALAGLFGMPTVINNVITLASVPFILAQGATAYQEAGSGRSRGTLPVQLAGNVRCGGLVEVPFGISLRELLEEFGQGTWSGRPIRAVQVGGPLGAYLSVDQFDTPLDYEAFAAIGAVLGHGGIVVFDDSVDMAAQARYAMEFCAIESCGKCTPCRIGSTRGVEVIDRIILKDDQARDIKILRDLCDTMVYGSLCAMGGMTPYPVLSALDRFAEDFHGRRRPRAA
jgi:formate dehydrogenase iron-sulfur subunit